MLTRFTQNRVRHTNRFRSYPVGRTDKQLSIIKENKERWDGGVFDSYPE